METHQLRPHVCNFQNQQPKNESPCIQCYTPTNEAEEEVKARFYDSLNHRLKYLGARDLIILMGDLNAKIGGQNEGYQAVMEKIGFGVMNENGEIFVEICVNNVVIKKQSIKQHGCHQTMKLEITLITSAYVQS